MVPTSGPTDNTSPLWSHDFSLSMHAFMIAVHLTRFKAVINLSKCTTLIPLSKVNVNIFYSVDNTRTRTKYMSSQAKRLCTDSMSSKKIGTHNGTFHCDEVLACFILRQLPEYKVCRFSGGRVITENGYVHSCRQFACVTVNDLDRANVINVQVATMHLSSDYSDMPLIQSL